MPDQLQTIVQRMVEAGEPEQNIAAVIQHYKSAVPQGLSTERPSPLTLSPAEQADVQKRQVLPGQGAPNSEGARGVLRMMKEHPIETAATIGGIVAPEIVGPIGLGMKAAPWITRILSATLGGAGGAGIGMTENAIAGEAPSPTTPGGVLTEMASQGAQQGAAQTAGEAIPAAGNLMVRGGKRMYQSALKPLRSIAEQNPGKDLAAIGLEHNLPLRRGTLSTINDKVKTLEADIASKLADNQTPIDLQRAVDDARTRLTGPGGKFRDLGADRGAVDRQIADLTEAHPDFTVAPSRSQTATPEEVAALQGGDTTGATRGPTLRDAAAPEAQKFKQRLYGRIRDASWGELSSPQQETLKSIAHGVNDQLKATTDIGPQLSTQGDLLAFQDALSKSLPRIENRNIVPLESAIYMAAHPTAHGAAAALTAVPRVNDVIGRGMFRTGNRIGTIPPAMTANLMKAALLARLMGEDQQP